MACAGEITISVDNTFVGFGTTKDDALADLLDRIAEAGERRLDCRRRTCDDGSCEPSVDLEDVESGRMVRYGRAGRLWKAFLFGRNQPGLSAQLPVYCSCAPAEEDDGGVVFRKLPAGPSVVSLRVGRATVDIDQHVPGKRCVDGRVTGTARNIAPVTDPNKEAAEQAVRRAARASAVADAQLKCDKGKCSGKDETCTFVKIFEASSITSTPSRDPNGAVVWTCTLVSFEVIGVCVCRKREGKKERPKPEGKSERPRRAKA